MNCLRNKISLVLVFFACSTGLIGATQHDPAQSLSPEMKTVCQKLKSVFSNLDNKISWRCFAGALFHYIGLKKTAQTDGTQSALKNDPRFAELQGVLAEVVDATNMMFIADKLSKYEYIIAGMSLDELASILSQRLALNANDQRDEKGKSKCDYKSIIKAFETVKISSPKEKEL